MKLKKKAKKIILAVVIILLLVVLGFVLVKKFQSNGEVKETKIVSKIEKYGYVLKDNKPKAYKKMFEELEEILSAKEVDEEAYVKKIAEMYIYDFYSLDDKSAKTDVGGVDFVYPPILQNYLQNAEDTYYKYVESNIYENRVQKLPIVNEITIEKVEKIPFAYGEKNDEEAYQVEVSWNYTDRDFDDYQKGATLIFIHDDIKLCLVELQ